ncbi:hypothetical protein Aperf_G00000121511 [Anoplocephala perfoliata]
MTQKAEISPKGIAAMNLLLCCALGFFQLDVAYCTSTTENGNTFLSTGKTAETPQEPPAWTIWAILFGIFIPISIIIIVLLLLYINRERIPCVGKIPEIINQGPYIKIDYFEPHSLSYITEIPLPTAFEEFSSRLQNFIDSDQFPDLLDKFDNERFTENFETEYHLTRKIAKRFPDRNRYANVLPYDQTLVILGYPWSEFRLRNIGSFTTDDKGMHYINASYIRRPVWKPDGRALGAPYSMTPEYIATQAPLPDTVADFLLMVYEQRSPLIVMLCPPEEKAQDKYFQYWPDTDKQTFESERCIVEVSKISESFQGSICIRKLSILPKEFLQPWELTHFQLLTWADKSADKIGTSYELIDMHLHFTKTHPVGDFYGPTVVHCSAGVGRTGTLITARFALERLRSNPQKIDIIGTIMAIRKFRPMMVQVSSQVEFLFEFIEYCIQKEHISTSPQVPTPCPNSLAVQSANQQQKIGSNPPILRNISENEYTNLPKMGTEHDADVYVNIRDENHDLVVPPRLPPRNSNQI